MRLSLLLLPAGQHGPLLLRIVSGWCVLELLVATRSAAARRRSHLQGRCSPEAIKCDKRLSVQPIAARPLLERPLLNS